MKRHAALLAVAIIVASTIAASDEPARWSNIERDVWIDQQLERPVLLYRDAASGRLLLMAKSLGDPVVLDTAAGEVRAVPARSVTPESDLSAVRVSGLVGEIIGRVSRSEDEVVIGNVERRQIVISRHQSPSGELPAETFLSDYPVWRSLMESYEPDADAIERLRAVDEPVELSVVFATWCGDSRREVPRLLRAIEAAANRNLSVRLIGIDAEFERPLDLIQERRIINVPTVIVERGGEEIGRIIETPAAGTIEADLAAIVAGATVEHPGRWTREARTGHGVYALEFPDGGRGSETWENFSTASGGRLAHSIIRAPRLEREIWHRFDAQGRTEFIEITDRTGDGVRRSRFRVSDDHVRVTSRGNRSGIIDQYLGLPRDCVFATGSVLSDGLECGALSDGAEAEITRYSVPLDECASVGCLETVTLVRGSSTEVETGLGLVRASEIEIAAGESRRIVWISNDHPVPLRMEAPDRRATLIRYETGG